MIMSHHVGKGLVKYFLNVSQNLGLLFYCDLLYMNMYLCIDIQDASNFKCELASKVLFLGRFELSFFFSCNYFFAIDQVDQTSLYEKSSYHLPFSSPSAITF